MCVGENRFRPGLPADVIAAKEDVMQPHRRHRKLRYLGASIALVLSVGLMEAPTTAAAGADVYGVGGGSIRIGDATKIISFAFSGHSGPNGDFGSFKWTQDFESFEARVDLDCVNVFPTATGAAGWLQGQVKRVSPHPNIFGIDEGEELAFYIEDNGGPSDPIPDGLFGAYFGIPPQFCKTQGLSFASPITHGNINIKLAD